MLNLAYPMPMTFIVALIVTILGVIIGSLSGSVAGEPEAGMQN
jgi:ABC-type dipeptide/oligopeptide/nickel transport system permease subunit